MKRLEHAVRLEFGRQDVQHANLSAASCVGRWLFVAGDETSSLERLESLPPRHGERLRFGRPVHLPLAALMTLPGSPQDEADLEGLAIAGDALWLVGSHGLKRKKPRAEDSPAKQAARLARTSLDGNRRLLACLPLAPDSVGAPRPCREFARPDGLRRGGRLHGDIHDNELTLALRGDPHLGPFLAIPGKDNGLDVEGIATDGRRVLLGLRGPVLRGHAILLEIELTQGRQGTLHLKPLDEAGTKVRKHFVNLGGRGVRDLHFDGDDLLLLAGPTMDLDGDVRLLRWRSARTELAAATAPDWLHRPHWGVDVELRHGPRCDRAEAVCALPEGLGGLPPGCLLVLHDAPAPARRADGGRTLLADLLMPD